MKSLNQMKVYLMMLLIYIDPIISLSMSLLHVLFVTYPLEIYATSPTKHAVIKIIQTRQQNIRRISLINSISTNIISPIRIHWAQFWIVLNLMGSFDKRMWMRSANSRGKRVRSNYIPQWDSSQKNKERWNNSNNVIA